MRRAHRWEWGVVAAGLLLFGILSMGAALRESPTIDEPLHAASGFVYWTTGKYFLDPIQPPLMRLWVAAPLTLMHLQLPLPPPDWVIHNHLSLSDVLLNYNAYSEDSLVNIARCMTVVLGLGLGILVWRWSREVYGSFAAGVSLLVYSACPMMIAFGHLASPDFGSAAMSVLTLYVFWRFQQRPTRKGAFYAGLGMGLNLATKFSGLLLAPAMMWISWIEDRSRKPSQSRKNDYFLAVYVAAAVLALVVVYKGSELHRIGQGLEHLHQVLTSGAGGANQYFRGRINAGAPWPWFMTACLLLKTPVPFLLLIAVGLFRLKDEPHRRFSVIWILLPCAVYLAGVSLSQDQAGIRRILFLYPMLCIWIGGVAASLWKDRPRWRIAGVVLAGWYVLETLLLFPRYLSYYNPLAGGPANGYRWMVDCNLDWGQGLKALGLYMKEQGVDRIYLSYFGGGNPKNYGIRYRWVGTPSSAFLMQHQAVPLKPEVEKRVLLAVSATNWGGAYFTGREVFDWLRPRRPDAVLMDSIFVYDLTHDPDAIRLLQRL